MTPRILIVAGALAGLCLLAAGQAQAGGGVIVSFGAYHGVYPYGHHYHRHHYYSFRRYPYVPFGGHVYRWREPRPTIQWAVPPEPTGAPDVSDVAPPPSAELPYDRSYCREFTGTAVIDGQERPIFGTACRQPDGHWRIVSD